MEQRWNKNDMERTKSLSQNYSVHHKYLVDYCGWTLASVMNSRQLPPELRHALTVAYKFPNRWLKTPVLCI
jgi:hypothetical protein